MDLDYDAVRALASPTRIKILNLVLDDEATTTKISEELDKSKSTVSSHLKVLAESGLVEKDDEEGRRRVIYRPTSKSRAIIEGRERKVKFSIVSSAFTAFGGIFLLGQGIKDKIGFQAEKLSQQAMNQGSTGTMGAMDAEGMASTTAKTINQTAQDPGGIASLIQGIPENTFLLVSGSILMVTAVTLIGYAFLYKALRGKEEE